jgi:TonB family protein
MKKMMLMILAGSISFGLAAQEDMHHRKMEETKVEPPQFSGRISQTEKPKVIKSPECCYIQDVLSYPESAITSFEEGIVVVEFTVEPDASVSNIFVVNSASFELDNAVIECIKGTDGMWRPGKVNDKFTPMQKEVTVIFDIKDTPPLKELARSHYRKGIKLHQKGETFKKSETLAENKKNKKAEKQFKRSLEQLQMAKKYCTNESAIILWEALNYEQLGEKEKMEEKMEEFEQIVSSQQITEPMNKEYNLAVIIAPHK